MDGVQHLMQPAGKGRITNIPDGQAKLSEENVCFQPLDQQLYHFKKSKNAFLNIINICMVNKDSAEPL